MIKVPVGGGIAIRLASDELPRLNWFQAQVLFASPQFDHRCSHFAGCQGNCTTRASDALAFDASNRRACVAAMLQVMIVANRPVATC
jgi:hypothetical protein